MKFEETLLPEQSDILTLRNMLRKYNGQKFEPANQTDFAIYIKNDSEDVIGGISGKIFGNWMDVDYLVVHESLRRNGLGRDLLKKAEELAIRSNCKNIFLYTFDFQGKDFYPKFGFKEVYVKRQYPLTGTEHFFVKKLSNEIDKEAGEILEETE
ncbi:MAG: GNAT family N-acetyltransferase [Patescibacteria group bacterium]|jgi:N-acetylglutamate synthase-like GNAT family acetyltransferase|uniref:GNAT family N-acetyltransferase n=1 Tax=Leuconostoc gelidum group TaxID=3016637 RepID=UPI001CC66164|nr:MULTISPECIES: GNAT family N-acetyltransferase [Leuconostoc gelidum group]MBZ5955997.1 GNAT family N-acetyltransferase [Leuconostoc gasicomitatum]MBZ5972641.1 GNAT family N-acetyltransferase [Leuconostoc gasicomitatum]MBZ6000610.1 GNAT family N-acetyltransferase [Leuconostoc gelidum subsp. gelidum]